nr:MacB family efflux pump subunit [Peristeroidobacter soli]
MAEPLLQLRAVRREFPAGNETVAVLKGIDLSIDAGQMVAIVGASGSGKSTLMNILGCLDRPTGGDYLIAGRSTALMSADQLAQLRREHLGFIFQRYHLLGDLTALGNVEVPAVYAGRTRAERHAQARQLLSRLGLEERMFHKPSQLSGGQQQRVSIARSLMNGGHVILADEPTGALDSRSGAEVMKILSELHSEGRTVILVTHDMAIAEHADRIIVIQDGQIVADRQQRPARSTAPPGTQPPASSANRWQALKDRFAESFRMALLAMGAHKMRTFLTMLGIIIGTASVVLVVALGNASQQRILKSISSLGTDTIEVFPGAGWGDLRAGRVQTLLPADADALSRQSYVDSVTPALNTQVTARYGNLSVNAQVNGVGHSYFRVKGMTILAGRAFAANARNLEQVAVIDETSVAGLLGHDASDPIGKVILLGKVPCRIVGVARQAFGRSPGSNLTVWLPYATVMARMLGQGHLSNITVRIAADTPVTAAEQAVTRLLTQRHGRKDFFLQNAAQMRETIESTTKATTLLISSIAAIALIVGGIGVMNIMLVSVTERTREIGVRVAVGGRRSDILQQFLIEAVLVCLLGGIIGVALALAAGVVGRLWGGFEMIFSAGSIVAAFACSTLIGIVFGFLPARNAANLNPVEALARE